MVTEKNKSIVMRHYNEVLIQKKINVVDEIYASVIELENGQSISREQFKSMAGMTAAAFPDLVVTVIVQIAEADTVATYFKACGTHTGAFLDKSGTGKRIELRFMHIHEIENGRIKKLHEFFDMHEARQQLGLNGQDI